MAKRKTFDAGALAARAKGATQGLSNKDRRREVEAEREMSRRSLWPLDKISLRPSGDTRPLHPEHVVSLAESIAALSLIEPLVIDANGKLIAGGHRFAACRLLDPRQESRQVAIEEVLSLASVGVRTELEERISVLSRKGDFDPSAVPVRVFDFDAQEDQERALLIETSENTQRRDYTRAEVVTLYKRLIEAGYTDRRGKPKRGERAAKPVLATVIGRSLRTVRRVLQEKDPSLNRTNAGLEEAKKAVVSLQRALGRLEQVVQKEGCPEEVENLSSWFDEAGVSSRLSSLLKSLHD